MKHTLIGPSTAKSLAWLIAAVLSLAGCSKSGPALAPVAGRVTLDGEPLAGARLRFQPESPGGSPSYGSTNAEGHYELGYKRGVTGALIGWHVVRIEPGPEGATRDGKKIAVLPARYNQQSELRREVKPDVDNEIDLALTTGAE